jgi:hypothetical protein
VESTKVPIHKGMAIGNTNITLTAHVLISLEEVSAVLQVKENFLIRFHSGVSNTRTAGHMWPNKWSYVGRDFSENKDFYNITMYPLCSTFDSPVPTVTLFIGMTVWTAVTSFMADH